MYNEGVVRNNTRGDTMKTLARLTLVGRTLSYPSVPGYTLVHLTNNEILYLGEMGFDEAVRILEDRGIDCEVYKKILDNWVQTGTWLTSH
jgi:hypothetical protein